MAQTNINMRIDEDLKKQFDKTCAELGLSMTSAFNLFARAVVRSGSIPFIVSVDMPNKATMQAIDDVNNHRNLSKPYDNLEELFEDLNA